MLVHTDGIVLKSTLYGDNSKIVTLYTRSEGLLSLSVRHRIGKARIKALLAPLTMVHVVVDLKNANKIHHPKEITLAYQYKDIDINPVKGGILLFLNELLIKVIKEEEANAALFGFLVHALKTLDQQDPLHPSYHLSVMLHLTRYLGFFPQNGSWQPEKCFDLREGSFVFPSLTHLEILAPDLSLLMNQLIRVSFDEFRSFNVNRAQRNQLLDALISFYHLHVAGFSELKSISVLRSLFD